MAIEDFKMLEPSNVVSDLVAFVEKQLPQFPSSEEFIQILEKKKNENQHSLAFCIFMTQKSKAKFIFARENAQKGSSVVDIGVYWGANLILTVEAKLLPTPIGSKTQPRAEHEYVYGKGAGIQRFKDGDHGRDNANNLLTESGLIAFVKEKDFQFWLGKTNEWIIDTQWGHMELLRKIYFKSTGKLLSTHTRINSPSILIHHFWVKVS